MSEMSEDYDCGREEGYEEGYDEGYNKGFEDGWNAKEEEYDDEEV